MEKKKKEKKILLRCYDGEKNEVEDTLDCHIHVEIVVEAGLLVMDFASLYNFVSNC